MQNENAAEGHRPVRLLKPTADALDRVAAAVNRKEFGKRIKPDAIISFALGLIGDREIAALRDRSLSNADRLETMFREFAEKDSSVTKDQFLGMILDGAMSPMRGRRPRKEDQASAT